LKNNRVRRLKFFDNSFTSVAGRKMIYFLHRWRVFMCL
jgi:hypothetical protein